MNDYTVAQLNSSSTFAAMSAERALELINKNTLNKPLTADEVFIGGMTVSTQNIDSHKTRMSANSIKNYADDFNRGVPVLTSHNHQSLPVGRTFYGETSGTQLSDNATFEDKSSGLSVNALFYIQRGVNMDGCNTNDLIRGIEGGTTKDVSVGFHMNNPNSLVRCSVCKNDMMDWSGACEHVPGMDYKGKRAFGWVDNASAAEVSLVFKGSNPNAFIVKALRQLGISGARALYPDVIPLDETMERKIEILNKKKGKNMEWEVIFKRAGVVTSNTPLTDDESVAMLVEKIQKLSSEQESLHERAQLGDTYLKNQVDEAIKQRVRANGADSFQVEAYTRSLHKLGDIDAIIDIAAGFKSVADAKLTDERPTDTNKRDAFRPTTKSNYK